MKKKKTKKKKNIYAFVLFNQFSILLFTCFEGRIWDLIVSVSDLCSPFCFVSMYAFIKDILCPKMVSDIMGHPVCMCVCM